MGVNGPLSRGFGYLLAFFHPAARVAEAEAFLARRIDLVQLLARDVEPAQRPLEAPDGTFRAWVRDVGCRLCSHYVTRASRLHRKHRRLAASLEATRRTVAEGSAARTAAEPTRSKYSRKFPGETILAPFIETAYTNCGDYFWDSFVLD